MYIYVTWRPYIRDEIVEGEFSPMCTIDEDY
jgi:hypothetical protein